MRTGTLLAILVSLSTVGCEDDQQTSIPRLAGLSLYWDHEVFGAEGRRLRFEATSINELENDYELVFSTSKTGNTLTARLVKSVNVGACQYFPWPVSGNNDPAKCNASGDFYFTDLNLSIGNYTLEIITPYFKVDSKLTVGKERIELEIPANDYIVSPIDVVYPIPKDLLFGSIIYQGEFNANDANGLLDKLQSLGLTKTTVPNYPYRHLEVDENGSPIDSHWEPDYHAIRLLFNMNDVDFETIVEVARDYFNQKDLNIYLYTSNGDQGLMDKATGVAVVYGP